MKTALITTTIHEPVGLELIRELGPGIRFFIAGDDKTLHAKVQDLSDRVGNSEYLHPLSQHELRSSEFIGWNSIQRRNAALWKAVAWGADIIYTWDTDNIPIAQNHLTKLYSILLGQFHGGSVSGIGGWF